MYKNIMTLAAASTLALGLAGCAPGQNTPGATFIGTAAGGLLGGAIFHGSAAGVIGGALVGGSLGYIMGRQMDRQDRINMQSAIINTPVNQQASWTNAQTNTTYVVRPVRNYRYRGWACREYMTRVKIGGKWKQAYGKACKTPAGWKIVS